jgi:mRNA-degrading endonuclease toxin of MazEF toxin-antitoxin module
MVFSAGDVALVPFPYRDRLAERARPAVVVSAKAYNQHGDVVVAAGADWIETQARLRMVFPSL